MRRLGAPLGAPWIPAGAALGALALLLGWALAQPDAGGPGPPEQAPLFRDASQPLEVRVQDLLGRMTLAEKVGQMTQINLSRLMGSGEWDRGPLSETWLQRTLVDANVGSLLSGGGAAPVPNEPRAWAETVNALQGYALENTRLGIPILYGVDAVHGHNNVLGATIFPHNLGLAAAFDPALVAEVARATARDVAATGVTWNFSPVADLGRDPRWGRFYETFGENPALASALVAAHVSGQQQVPRVASTIKHFAGYGQGASGRDRAPAELSLRALRAIHLPAFAAGIRAGAPTVMINSGSINGVPVHASRYLLTEVLRGELGFAGVALSDWGDIDKLVSVHRVAADLEEAVALAVNAGVDVVMVPHDATGFTAALLAQVAAGAVSEARIDEAAGRVLALKLALGLFEHPYVDPDMAASVIEGQRLLARRAALAGLTLLENRQAALPLRAPRRVLVTGPGAIGVPMQMGGWTIQWQGLAPGGDMPPAVTVLEAMQASAPAGVEVAYHFHEADDLQSAVAAADTVVVVLGEPPYAEAAGDSADLLLPARQERLVEDLSELAGGTDTKLIAVLFAGRPLILPVALQRGADAILMAYLPGSEAGAAIADVIYGRYSPSGRLPFTWPASAGQVPITGDEPPAEAQREALYELGHGLSYARFRYHELSAEATNEGVRLRLQVENVGERAGGHTADDPAALEAVHTVLGWVGYPVSAVMRPARELVGFTRLSLAPGEAQQVEILVPYQRLAAISGDVASAAERRVLGGRYVFEVGDRTTTLTLRERAVSLRAGYASTATAGTTSLVVRSSRAGISAVTAIPASTTSTRPR